MFLVDSHCHLDSLNYESKTLADVLAEATKNKVKHCLNVATTLSGYQKFVQNNEIDSRLISLSCGIHPLNIDDKPLDYDLFDKLAHSNDVVALGETGLDYFYRDDNKMQQQEVFSAHISLSKKYQKPIIVHTRSAKDDTISIIQNENPHSGVLHCFTEDLSAAKKLLDLGFYISFSGIVTFKNAEQLRDVVKYVPLDRMLIETDSPYLAPVPYRGKENQPAYVKEVAKFIAALKGADLDAFANQTTANFCKLFNVKLC